MKIHMRVTASLLMEQLGTGLYTSVGQRIMELVRNSARACMPDPKKWEPKKVRIEVFLTPNHPLAHGETALTVLDYGRGFTDPDLDRYFNWLGTPLSKWAADAEEDGIGDSQKGIGRMAALALNQGCFQPNKRLREKHGYYLLTRTSATGRVRFVEVVPGKLEIEGIETDRWLEPASTEMGPLKGIKGSFSAIVVPTPIFKDHKEIYEAVKWFLPRERDKMFDLKIGGKAVEPPPLETQLSEARTAFARTLERPRSVRRHLLARSLETSGHGQGTTRARVHAQGQSCMAEGGLVPDQGRDTRRQKSGQSRDHMRRCSRDSRRPRRDVYRAVRRTCGWYRRT